MRTTVFLSLGSNLGKRLHNILEATNILSAPSCSRVVGVSRVYETAPVGGPKGQPPFLNSCVAVRTHLSPRSLLRWIQRIEAALGRRRRVRWGPRTLDIDILLYGRAVIRKRHLKVPHPRMFVRDFVLAPLSDILSLRPAGKQI